MDKLSKCIIIVDFSLRKQAEKEAQEAQRKAKEAADLAAKEAAEQAKRDAEEAEELARKQKEDEVCIYINPFYRIINSNHDKTI